jgi:Tol biopolymer transport system component
MVLGALAALALGALALPGAAARDDLDLVSRNAAGVAADDSSSFPSISGDGNVVLFSSGANNLSAEDDDAVFNVFVRDLASGRTTLVNRATGLDGAVADAGGVWIPRVSGDGTRVAFDSAAANLATDDNNLYADIFVRDIAAGTTTFVSRASGLAGAAPTGGSFRPAISADGNRVAFSSSAVELSDEDAGTLEDVFLRDLTTNITTLVSRESGFAGTGGTSVSYEPALSADGRYVAFISDADNLSTADDNLYSNIFVRDTALGTTILANRAGGAAGPAANSFSGSPAISADGRLVAFGSSATNLSPDDTDTRFDVYVRDTVTDTTLLVSSRGEAPTSDNAGGPAISADGRYVAFQSGPPMVSKGVQPLTSVYVRDLQAGTTTLVSRAPGPAGAVADGPAGAAAISADGRYVAFHSDADNLSADDVDTFRGIFRRDVLGAAASSSAGGPAGPGQGTTAATTGRCAGKAATIVGTAKRDVIRGTAKRDVIAALGGNDLVRGLGGNDLICLGAGNDRGIGGAGADRILGQAGTDRLVGGLGRDLLEGGLGRDLLLGGAGLDRLLGLAGRDRAVGGAGNDVCKVETRVGC